MVENWDDDERSVCKMPYENVKEETYEEYTPVTAIIKQYYKEEDAKLCETENEHDYNPYVRYSEDEVEEYSDYSEDGNTIEEDDDYDEEEVGDDDTSRPKKIRTKNIEDIIDDNIYKRFSYL